MLIKHKLALNSAMLVVSMVLMLGLLTFAMHSLENNVVLVHDVDNVESSLLQLRRDEKDFLARKDLSYPEKFEKKLNALNLNIANLENAFTDMGKSVPQLNALKTALKDYSINFFDLVESQKNIGLDPKDGLYGKLRAAVHNVEEIIGEDNFELRAGMLQLRRNEKDFMLRYDEKYVSQLSDNTALLVGKVKASNLDQARKTNIINYLADYQTAFNNLVNEEKRLGLTHETGLRGKMREAVHKVEVMQDDLSKASMEVLESQKLFIESIAYTLFVIILGIAVFFTWVITKGLLKSINNMQSSMLTIAKTNDLTIVVDESGSDELADMAKAFNSMITSFKNLIVEVNHSVDTLNEATQKVAENISITTRGVDTQIQETDMVATAVTEMVATVDEIANNTHEAARKAESTNENAEYGKQGVNQTIAQISILSEKLLESEHVVNELAKDSQTIGSVLDVIRGIAEQTNLLALNAAIEAARAGEQGRGFAVVADEVRTLASRTQESTKEIEGIIGSLQTRTKEIVTHMATCRTQGADSAEQASKAGKLLEEITNDVCTIMEMNTAIATAIQEQSTVASEVNQHVVSIRDVAEHAGKMAHQNAQMSEELSQQAVVLRNEVSVFKV